MVRFTSKLIGRRCDIFCCALDQEPSLFSLLVPPQYIKKKLPHSHPHLNTILLLGNFISLLSLSSLVLSPPRIVGSPMSFSSIFCTSIHSSLLKGKNSCPSLCYVRFLQTSESPQRRKGRTQLHHHQQTKVCVLRSWWVCDSIVPSSRMHFILHSSIKQTFFPPEKGTKKKLKKGRENGNLNHVSLP